MAIADDLDSLYREMILDHSKHPRNFGRLEDASHIARGHNVLCGDQLTVYMRIRDGRIDDMSFEGRGCAIDVAAASLMTEAIKGKSVAEAQAAFDRFHEMLTGSAELPADTAQLGRLVVFQGVRRFPMRVKCATLPWHTLRAALEERAAPVSTE